MKSLEVGACWEFVAQNLTETLRVRETTDSRTSPILSEGAEGAYFEAIKPISPRQLFECVQLYFEERGFSFKMLAGFDDGAQVIKKDSGQRFVITATFHSDNSFDFSINPRCP